MFIRAPEAVPLPTHFSDMGFEVPSMDDYKELILKAKRSGTPVRSPRGAYVRWSPGNGIELWVHFTRKKGSSDQLVIAGAEPHFVGASRVKFGVLETIMKEKCELDGSLYGYVSPTSGDPESGAYPLLIDVPNFDAVRGRISAPSIVDLQVAAFPNQISSFADDSSYYGSQPEETNPPGPLDRDGATVDVEERVRRGGNAKLAAESFIPAGLFNPGGTPKVPRQAEGIMTGHVLECSTVSNPLTGRAFHRMKVRTYAATFDVVCDPSRLKSAPTPGNVISGVFWFTGQLLEPQTGTPGVG